MRIPGVALIGAFTLLVGCDVGSTGPDKPDLQGSASFVYGSGSTSTTFSASGRFNPSMPTGPQATPFAVAVTPRPGDPGIQVLALQPTGARRGNLLLIVIEEPRGTGSYSLAETCPDTPNARCASLSYTTDVELNAPADTTPGGFVAYATSGTLNVTALGDRRFVATFEATGEAIDPEDFLATSPATFSGGRIDTPLLTERDIDGLNR